VSIVFAEESAVKCCVVCAAVVVLHAVRCGMTQYNASGSRNGSRNAMMTAKHQTGL